MKNLLLLSVLVLSLISCNNRNDIIEESIIRMGQPEYSRHSEVKVTSDIIESNIRVRDSIIVINTMFNSLVFNTPGEEVKSLELSFDKSLVKVDSLYIQLSTTSSIKGKVNLTEEIIAYQKDMIDLPKEIKRLSELDKDYQRYSKMNPRTVLFKVWETSINVKFYEEGELIEYNEDIKLKVNARGNEVLDFMEWYD
jgi:hypothetical protein